MTIAQRLYLLIAIVVVATSALAGVGIVQMRQVFSAADFSNVSAIPSMVDIDKASVAFMTMRAQVWKHIASREENKPAMAKVLDTTVADLAATLEHYGKTNVLDAKDRALLEADQEAFSKFRKVIDYTLKLSTSGKTEPAQAFLFGSDLTVEKFDHALAEHRDYIRARATSSSADARARLASAQTFSILAALAAIAAVTVLGLMLARRIGRALAKAAAAARAIASGDLTGAIDGAGRDEIGLLMGAMGDMSGSLAVIVRQARTGADTIAIASAEIATGNMDLSSRTEQQAAALEQTAASMHTLTGTVKQNADNAKQANTLAANASQSAADGGAVVGRVVAAMGSINGSSKKIVDIIGVIDSIAFQTNILALNAAVEAARAGEQGRGFAVVASEVRNLAQRSAGAAKEIKALIDSSAADAKAGSDLAGEAGAAMERIVTGIRQVTDVVAEISAASQEQATGIEQVNSALTHMDGVTQQNAALVEQAAAAAASLREQAQALLASVGKFIVNEQEPGEAAEVAESESDFGAEREVAEAAPVARARDIAAPRATKPAPARAKPAAKLALKPATSVEGDWEEF